MREQRRVSKNYSRVLLLELLDREEPSDRAAPTDFVFVDGDLNALKDTLCAGIAVLADSFEYYYANVCVLTPASRDIAGIAELLAEGGRPSIDLRERTFRFSEAKSLRLLNCNEH